MQKYTNRHNIPLSVAVFLATDTYDRDATCISATTLVKPLKQVLMGLRVPQDKRYTDISSVGASRIGTAIHAAIERAWLGDYESTMKTLGYGQDLIDRVLVNPLPEELTPDCIPVYLEKRSYREVLGYRVSGQFDIIIDGNLEDFKKTSVYTWINKTNDKAYTLQGSIYRWLNPELITGDYITIQFIFTDWTAAQARYNADYPQQMFMSYKLPLLTLKDTREYIVKRLLDINKYAQVDEVGMPPCSDEDLWRKPVTYKYYKNPNSLSRSTKNFTSRQEAFVRMQEDNNVGRVVEVPGQVVACRYCDAFGICKQAASYVADGSLTV